MELKNLHCGFGDMPEELENEFRLSPSKIKDALESMKLYKWRLDRKMKTTAAMELGTLLHMAILEPERFAQVYVKNPKPSDYAGSQILKTNYDMQDWLVALGMKKTGNKLELIERIEAALANMTDHNIVLWDRILANACSPDQLMMTDKEEEQVVETIKEIDSQPFTKWLTKNGEREKKMWFREPGTGVILKMRVDFYSSGVGESGIPVVMDLKKVPDVRVFKMQRWLDDTKTAVQLAINRDCVKAITGKTPKCIILAIDAKEPYNVVPYVPDPAALEIAEYQYKQTIVAIQQAHHENKFTGLSDGTPISLNLPHYALNREQFNEDQVIND
jgi:hypothetical protein